MIGKITLSIAVVTMILAITPLVHASKLTKTSYEDGYNRGVSDAQDDFLGLNGHGYDDSRPSSRTDTHCRGYVNGYNNAWNSQSGSSGGVTSTQSQGQSQTQSQGTDINIHIGQSQSQSQSQAQR